MGCTSSTSRRTASRLHKVEEAIPTSPSMSLSDIPVLLESPTSTTGYRQMSTKLSTPPPVHPPRRRLHRRRRREPHLDHHLTDRLGLLARYLQRASKIDYHKALHAQTQRAIDDLLDNIHSFFFLYEAEKRPLWRLAQTGRLVQQVESFHRTLDAITARCGVGVAASSGVGPSLPRWQARWRRMRAEPDELELLESTFTFVASCCSNSMKLDTQLRMMSLPEWFVAPHERTRQQHKWQRAAVTVQKAPKTMTSDECLKLANSWSRLQHPHVMKLFGACHVSRQRFFVVAGGTPLTRCFGDDGFPLWRALHEAALALRYLHERRIGLDTLSCADLILFRNGDRDAVMLTGFNLKQMKSALESSAFFGNKNATVEEDPLLEDDASDVGYDDVDMIRQEDEVRLRLKTLYNESCESSTKKYWQAPELLRSGSLGPTEASDVFVLGMCVIEAFSGGNVWDSSKWQSDEHGTWYRSKQTVMNGMPPRPVALDDAWQWALVERMVSLDPKNRPSLTEVLASFQVFADNEEKTNIEFSSTRRKKKTRNHSLRKTQPRATSASIACALSEVQAWCDEASESSALNYQLYERMDDIAAQLEVMDPNDVVVRLPVLASVIFRFRDFLQRHVNENPILRLAATRQVIETIVELHTELDVLMDKLRLNRLGASIHSWILQYESYRDQLWKRMRFSFEMDGQTLSGELDGEQELSLLGALLAFESKERSSSYAPQDLDLLQSTLVKVKETYQIMVPTFRTTEPTLPKWFIPPYEVLLNELDTFSRGAFGSIHFGQWMNSDVVVKKMLPPDQAGTIIPLRSRRGDKSNAKESLGDPYQRFLHEMSVWSTLKHQNVLKLLGACHVGQDRFFVSEYAAQGTIDCFVASMRSKDRGDGARRLLHEVALGLRYLHTQNVVHADLRCNNILVSAQGTIKLADFGFSSLKSRRRVDDATVDKNIVRGSCRWVAPECLNGEAPTFASNVYSFAMCAIEVISGDLPWGSDMTETSVRSKVRNGLTPSRPAHCFSDSEWCLIERMCCYNPQERITIKDVVKLRVYQ
ncbi:TKL protein kinase [Phytophthora megakarya]|uniref:TKL protein kinase n=1 Tax=Phytophthora megakarya TaxID=4795 RepID=A0A225WNP2_9STRA|nr:TKL protein kinase [Phytophthora megakarya]